MMRQLTPLRCSSRVFIGGVHLCAPHQARAACGKSVTATECWSNLLHKKYRFCLTVPSPSKTRHVVFGYTQGFAYIQTSTRGTCFPAGACCDPLASIPVTLKKRGAPSSRRRHNARTLATLNAHSAGEPPATQRPSARDVHLALLSGNTLVTLHPPVVAMCRPLNPFSAKHRN